MASLPRPEEVEVDETYRFVAPLIAGCRRVLDVGCGNGLLARRLTGDGFQVTALDRSLGRTERSPGIRYVESDFLGFEDAPHDALVFSASLHHLAPLDRALETAEHLLRPCGLLVAADFDLEAPDRETVRWYYDLEGLLLTSGLFRPDKVRGSETDDPLARWHAEHAETPPLHTGAAMRDALSRRFTLLGSDSGPYLYRYLAGSLEPTPHATRIGRWIRDTEARHIASGALKAVGFRLWARREGER
jgi:SAM-dependent methyltransferase